MILGFFLIGRNEILKNPVLISEFFTDILESGFAALALIRRQSGMNVSYRMGNQYAKILSRLTKPV